MNKNITLGIIFFLIIVSTFLNSNLLEGLDVEKQKQDDETVVHINKLIDENIDHHNTLGNSHNSAMDAALEQYPKIKKKLDSMMNLKKSYTKSIDLQVLNLLGLPLGTPAAPKVGDYEKDITKKLQKPENQQLLIICSALHAIPDDLIDDLPGTKNGGVFGSSDSGDVFGSGEVFGSKDVDKSVFSSGDNGKET